MPGRVYELEDVRRRRADQDGAREPAGADGSEEVDGGRGMSLLEISLADQMFGALDEPDGSQIGEHELPDVAADGMRGEESKRDVAHRLDGVQLFDGVPEPEGVPELDQLPAPGELPEPDGVLEPEGVRGLGEVLEPDEVLRCLQLHHLRSAPASAAAGPRGSVDLDARPVAANRGPPPRTGDARARALLGAGHPCSG